MRVVGIDTMVLIWGYREWPTRSGTSDSVREMQVRSRLLLRDLSDQKATIVLPTVAISELLCRVASTNQAAFLEELNRRFFVKSLDLMAATLAAELMVRHLALPEADRLARKVLKADALIVATARSVGAGEFYSHDRACRALASSAGMIARDLPTHSEDLFTNLETRTEAGDAIDPGGPDP